MMRTRSELEKRIGEPVPHWTLHELRRTMATGLQPWAVRLEVTEAVLNHLSGARFGIVGVHQRHNDFGEKRAAFARGGSRLNASRVQAAPPPVPSDPKLLARDDRSTARLPLWLPGSDPERPSRSFHMSCVMKVGRDL
jgi:hypothetical protein